MTDTLPLAAFSQISVTTSPSIVASILALKCKLYKPPVRFGLCSVAAMRWPPQLAVSSSALGVHIAMSHRAKSAVGHRTAVLTSISEIQSHACSTSPKV